MALPDGLPVAVSDSRLVGHYPSVVADQAQGTEAAMQHLVELGHRRIHHIAGPADSEPALVRAETWRRCLIEAGIEPPPVIRGDWTAHSGYLAGQELAADEAVTAVFCANDEMAFGLIRALHERGRRVPEEVSVVGFDDIGLSGYSFPPLTTVRQDFHRIGKELVTMVLRHLRDGHPQAGGAVIIPTELVVRETTAPPRR